MNKLITNGRCLYKSLIYIEAEQNIDSQNKSSSMKISTAYMFDV